jgi:hypothetical protein
MAPAGRDRQRASPPRCLQVGRRVAHIGGRLRRDPKLRTGPNAAVRMGLLASDLITVTAAAKVQQAGRLEHEVGGLAAGTGEDRHEPACVDLI